MPIVAELKSPVATVTIDRPEAMNAMTREMYGEITDALREIDRDPDVLVGIVTGTGGRAFSAGHDLKQLQAPIGDGGWRPWRADRWDLGLAVSKPLIAAIDGYALAGGLELAVFCDIRIATPRSQFGTPEIKWNLLHGYGALRLPAIVGLSNALMLLLTGEFIDAEEARRIGLINRIVDPENLMTEARALAESIAEKGSDAVRMTKELALRSIEAPLDQNLRLYHEYMSRTEGSEEQVRRTGDFGGKPASRAER